MMKWMDLLEESATGYEELPVNVSVSPEEFNQVVEKYPMRIPEYYLSLIGQDGEADPIRKMSVPSIDELSAEGSFDTSGEQDNTVMKGLQHKYNQTALILSTNQCAMYCRYCFRRRLVGLSEGEVAEDKGEIMNYIAEHEEIRNVLVSGGDSLLLSNREIAEYLEGLCAIDHLNYIRFGTKVPVVFPQRINEDEELLELFCKYARLKQIYVVTQYNHAEEISEESARAVKNLQAAGVVVKNQTVLLKGVNDQPEILDALLQKLTGLGIIPYYVFQCRPVTGITNQFQVPINRGVDIVEKAKSMQDGGGKSFRYILSDHEGKIEIVGKQEDGSVIFKFHQAKEPENQGKVFVRKLEDDVCWIR